ncbi:hypothetical protein D3C75_1052620 [compost metagenome]
MPQSFRLSLADVHQGYALRRDGFNFIQQLTLHARFQHRLKLIRRVEMVFDRVLGGVGNQNDFFDPGSHAFVDNILDQRLIYDRQHLFRDRLGRRQHAHTQTSNRNDGFQLLRHGVPLKSRGRANRLR